MSWLASVTCRVWTRLLLQHPLTRQHICWKSSQMVQTFNYSICKRGFEKLRWVVSNPNTFIQWSLSWKSPFLKHRKEERQIFRVTSYPSGKPYRLFIDGIQWKIGVLFSQNSWFHQVSSSQGPWKKNSQKEADSANCF